MATLEQRLQDVEYKFWVKDGLCLAYVKEGLEKFADERSKKLHDYVKSALPNNCTAFHNVCGHAKVSFDKNRMKWTLGCCVACDAYTDELVKLQSPPFKLKQSNWKNTKTQLWPHDHWNMSKVYMNEGQKASQKNSKDTDLCGILNFIENCSIPKVDIQNAQNLSKVRKARNKIFHSASMKMTKADFEASTKAMVDLLEDPFFICREKEAQNAVTAIKQEVKEAAYKGQVRPVLDYGSSICDPPGEVLQEELESVQKRAARFVTGYQTLATTPRHKRHKERNHVTEDTMLESTGLLNMKVGSRNQIDVMIDDDDKTCPWVSGCVFIPNGSLVLCDYRNNKIKMLNKALTMQASLSLHAQPWDIAVANNTTVVVTLLNSQRLQFVQVEPSLEKKQYIKLSMMCWGVEVVEDEIFITCFDKNGEGSVRVLDFEGIVKRRIVIQNGTQEFNMLKGPYNLTVSPASGNIFVSDYVGNVVTCMTSNGNVLYQYRDALLNGPKDILVDCSENILICSARAYNLQIVDAEGVKHRTLASSKDKIMKPWSVAYRSDDKTLVVGCQGKHLLVIGLEHSRRRRESTEDRI